jgi:hypothetical protein
LLLLDVPLLHRNLKCTICFIAKLFLQPMLVSFNDSLSTKRIYSNITTDWSYQPWSNSSLLDHPLVYEITTWQHSGFDFELNSKVLCSIQVRIVLYLK